MHSRIKLAKIVKGNMVHECGMKQSCFAFWISSEQEFVGFMGVNERKKREHRPRT